MIYLVYEQQLKLYGGIVCYSLCIQKKEVLSDLFILYFEFESHE
jgi:hypothetical protein